MSDHPGGQPPIFHHVGLFERLRRRGVLRVALSYAVISWLLLQIGDVVLDPLGAPAWAMRALILVLAAGFPISLVLAWYFELGPGGITVDHLPEGAARPHPRGWRRYADAMTIAVLLCIIAVLLARQEGWLEPAPSDPVIAVLPFTEIGADTQGYYGDGLADTLIHKLGQLAGLVVLASSSTFEFRGPELDLSNVAKKLGANIILEGSLQRTGGVLRVNTRLIDPETGRQRWTSSFNRRTGELFDVQDEIASAVISALRLVLTPEESERLVKRDTQSLSAFDAYQHARRAMATRSTEGIADALQYLFDATETDPGFALAHAALAEAYALASSYRPFDSPWNSVGPLARKAAETALSLDPDLGEAYVAEALVATYENDHTSENLPWSREQIAGMLEKAIELSPSNATAWKLYSNFVTGPEEKLERLMKAAQLEPRSGIIRVNIGQHYEDMGNLDMARKWYLLSIGAEEPFFELGVLSMAFLPIYKKGIHGLAEATRWLGSFSRAYPRNQVLRRDFCHMLFELGAFDQVEREMEGFAAAEEDTNHPLKMYRLGFTARLYRARGDLETAAAYAQKFADLYLPIAAENSWMISGPPLRVLDILPLKDLANGAPERALQRYQALVPEIISTSPGFDDADGLNARVMVLAARKLTGDAPGAETELRNYLQDLGTASVMDAGFSPFAAHAFLGETDAALAALQKAVDAGVFKGWWALRDGKFDADYAAVIADPRFQRLFDSLVQGIAEQRADYLAHPDLPLETALEVGLSDYIEAGKPPDGTRQPITQ